MKATITSKGQITIPHGIRERLHLKVGDQLEFDEQASVLIARRVVDGNAWEKTLSEWREASAEALDGHPWKDQSVEKMIDDVRGGPADPTKPE